MREATGKAIGQLEPVAGDAGLAGMEAGVGFGEALLNALKIDRYDLYARTFPVYIAIAPVILGLASILPQGLDLPFAGASALVLVPMSYAAGQFAAEFGKRLESGLWRKWDGPPTTRFLRHGDGEFNPATRARIHAELSRMGLAVPTREEQDRDGAASDVHWEACTEELIRRTRDRVRFPLVFEGLVQYGYRRNLLGLKCLGLPLSVAGFAVCSWRVWLTAPETPGAAVAASASVLCLGLIYIWVVWVRERTVAVAANRYARYLLEAGLDCRKGRTDDCFA